MPGRTVDADEVTAVTPSNRSDFVSTNSELSANINLDSDLSSEYSGLAKEILGETERRSSTSSKYRDLEDLVDESVDIPLEIVDVIRQTLRDSEMTDLNNKSNGHVDEAEIVEWMNEGPFQDIWCKNCDFISK